MTSKNDVVSIHSNSRALSGNSNDTDINVNIPNVLTRRRKRKKEKKKRRPNKNVVTEAREASILEVSDKRFTFELGMRLLEGFSRGKL